MKGDFEKKLDDIATELFNFVETAISGDDYVPPTDDTKNIANAANYYPSWSDFRMGGPVITHADSASLVPMTEWSKSFALDFIRWVSGDSSFNWSVKDILGFWIFRTRDDTSDAAI